jgi:hypothetical protein
MRGFILAAVCLIGVAFGQSCDRTYKDYMFCLKDRLTEDYLGFENEFRGDYIELADKCFGASGQCEFEYEKNYTAEYVLGRDGPLKGCRLCNTVSRAVRGMLEKATPESMKCIRGVFTQGIADALEPCIKKSIPAFTKPARGDLPDFDEGSYPHRKSTLDTTAAFFLVESNIGLCRRRQGSRDNRAKRQADRPVRSTRSCLDARIVNGKPIWPKHCNAMKSCRNSKVGGSCKQAFEKVETTTCDCIESGTNDIVQEINKVGRQLKQALDRGGDVQTECKNVINEALDKVKEDLDLDKYFQQLLGCIPTINEQLKSQFNIESLIRLGCRTLANSEGSSGQRARQLQQVIGLGTQLLSSMVNRVTRFCPGAQCRV